MAEADSLRPVQLTEDGAKLRLLDQRALPTETRWCEYDDVESVAEAIENLTVRGAPAIGCAAAFGLAAASHGFPNDPAEFRARVEAALDRLSRTRPTAVNLFVALNDMREALSAAPEDEAADALRARLRTRAQEHFDADLAACKAMGRHGAPLLPDTGGVLTHCNAGALATAGYGTALGVIRAAHAGGKNIQIYADETRPVLQGARLTAYELQHDGIPVTVIADNMAASMMSRGKIQAVITGADRIARNGDVANKIGTYGLAVLAKHHEIPFYVAAPWTTIDLALASGEEIPIEQRDGNEIRNHGGKLSTPADIPVENPAFDVTPAALVTAIVTEAGVHRPSEIELLGRASGRA